MKRILTFEIVSLLHDSTEAMTSGLIASRLHASAKRVQSAMPKLVKRGFVERVRKPSRSFLHYAVTDENWKFYLGATGQHEMASLSAQPHEAISRKLKFLDVLARGVHSDNPVLTEIMADYRALRRRQAEEECIE